MTELPLARELGRFVADFDLDGVEHRDELLERARWHLLDTIGLSLVAWTAEDDFGTKLVETQAGESGPCTVIGYSGHLSAPAAAFVNATLSHGWDFDDFFLDTIMHCESFAVCSSLAVAEMKGLPGRSLAEAFILACEIALRMAGGTQVDGGLYTSGFHNTSLFGAFGAAAATSHLLGLDAERASNALALTVSFAAGTSSAWTLGSGRQKPAQVGWATQAGVIAARLAAAGYGCSPHTIDGPRGMYFAHTHGGTVSRDLVLAGLGSEWRTLDLGLKLLPCGTLPQPTAQLVEQMVAEHSITAGEVQQAKIILPSFYAPVLRDLGDSLRRPPTGLASIGSVPCIAARIILDGGFRLEHRTDASVRDPRMLALADKIEVVADETPLELPLDERPVTITIVTDRGTFEGQLVEDGGSPRQLTREKAARKYRENAERVVSAERVDEIERKTLDIVDLADVRELTALLAYRADAERR